MSQQNCSWAACTVSSPSAWISAISCSTCHHTEHSLEIPKPPFWILIAAGVTEAEAYPGCFLRTPARSVWLAFWHLLENLGCPTGLGMCTGPLPRVPRKCELATSPWLFEVGNITVNFPRKWRSQILANLKQRLVQLFFVFKGSAYKSEEILSGSKFCSQKPLWNYYLYYRQWRLESKWVMHSANTVKHSSLFIRYV